MPKAHQRHLEWTPSRLIDWARTIGPQTAALVEEILADRPHPEQGYRSCLGILRLAKRYGRERLEAACTRAGAVEARSYRHVDSILKHGLDRLAPLAAAPPLTLPPSTNTCGAGPTTSERSADAHRTHARETPRAQAHRHGGGVDGAAAPGRHDGPRLRRALRAPRRGRVARPGEQTDSPAPCRKPSSRSRRRASKRSTMRR